MKTYVWDEEYSVAKGTTIAELKWTDLGTYGKRYLCVNYTVMGLPAQGHAWEGGKIPVVWLDQMKVVQYTRSAIFG